MLDGISRSPFQPQNNNVGSTPRRSEDTQLSEDRDADGRYIPLAAFAQGDGSPEDETAEEKKGLPKTVDAGGDAVELSSDVIQVGFITYLERAESRISDILGMEPSDGTTRRRKAMSAYLKKNSNDLREASPDDAAETILERIAIRVRSVFERTETALSFESWYDSAIRPLVDGLFSDELELEHFPMEIRDMAQAIPAQLQQRLAG
jgi:hypothetical protein